MAKQRLGITMRTVNHTEYPEPRDAIAHDWYRFLMQPEFARTWDWILLPNLGDGIATYAASMKLHAIVLSGGNDVGQAPERDATEAGLLGFAIERQLPVVGVCRGMQMIHCHFGGVLSPVGDRSHIGVHHDIVFEEGLFAPFERGFRFSVNSFHGQAIDKDAATADFQVLARSKDGRVESFRHRKLPIAGMMWHPERSHPFRHEELLLMRYFLRDFER